MIFLVFKMLYMCKFTKNHDFLTNTYIMRKRFYSVIALLSVLTFTFVGTGLYGQTDDPNLDRIPAEFYQYMKDQPTQKSSVVTIDGYDNYYLGVDFAEGHISENPNTPGEYFVAMNIDDTHYTMDGHDWSNSNVSWGGYSVRGDVLTAYDSDGNLYYENMYGASIQGCVLVKSADNGQTWSTPVVAISGNDKNWLAADMTDGPYSNYVYTVMTNSGSGNFARSTNQGVSFQNTFVASTQSLPGMMVCVGADGATNGGAVYIVTNSGGSFASTYTFYQSLDGGSTFTYKSAQNFAGYVGSSVNGRNSVQNMRTRPYPFITADNSNGTYRGRLYLIYASNQPAGNGNQPDIFCRYSDDGGSSWSAAETVNDDFPSIGNAQWHPATWCDYETGRLYVQWMDTRDSPTGTHAMIYGAYSDDGGQSFSSNQQISNELMIINCTSCGGGGTPRYQGDYNAIVSNPDVSMATWSDFRDGHFDTYTGYFPDYAMLLSPDNSIATGLVASFDVEVPSVKLWDKDVIFTAEIETPPAGSFTIEFPSGNTLSSFPGTVTLEVQVDEKVPVGFYEIVVTGKGPNGTPVHIRTGTVQVVPLTPPEADFSASNTTPCAEGTVDFFDESTGFPDAWAWEFEGAEPVTSTDENPTDIMYPASGTYTVTLIASNNAGNDTVTKTAYIDVIALPAEPASSDEEACFGSTIPDLMAEGTDIQWYDDSTLNNLVYSGNTFATGETEPGIYTYYATQTSGDCESNATIVTLTIFELPEVGLEAFEAICINEEAFELTGGSPEGGTYSGMGVMDDMFDPAVAGVGTHEITYTYTDGNGCTNDNVQMMTVNDLPDVSLASLDDVCINAEGFELSGGTPEGGLYIGAGVEAGYFDPAEAGVGTHEITYVYTDENGCENSAMQEITVNDIPDVNIGPDSQLCAGLEIILDATTAGSTSYEWYPGGETTAQITVDSTGIGIGSQMFICYVTDENECVSSDTVMVEFEDCSAIGELSEVNNVKLYPNPGHGVFSLQIDTEKPIELNIRVYNYSGVTVVDKQNIHIENSQLLDLDMTGQPSGVYLVTVWNNQGKWVEKLIIRN